jgi:hypothetical protein
LRHERAGFLEGCREQPVEHSLNVRDPESGLQLEVELDPSVAGVIDTAQHRDVLGLRLPVATPRDLVRLKAAAAADSARRPGKRGKDILDLARLVSAFPELRAEVPEGLRARVEEFVDPAEEAE